MIEINLLNRNESNHLLGNVIFTLVCLTIVTLVAWHALPGKVILYILALTPYLIPLLLVAAVIAFFVLTPKKETTDTETDTETGEEIQELFGGIIRNVPANFVWVIRNVWFSDITKKTGPKAYTGYKAMREGWKFFIPYFLHSSLDFIDLSPVPRDPQSITVNTKDNQTAVIDFRLITHVSDPIVFAVRVDENRKSFEDQAASVALNREAAKETQVQLTEFEEGKDELKTIGEGAKDFFNDRMKELGLGIEADAIEIQKILMPEEIRAAKEHLTVSDIRKDAADLKAEELKTIATETGADPTKVVIAEFARDGFTNIVDIIVNAFRTSRETERKENKGEKK